MEIFHFSFQADNESILCKVNLIKEEPTWLSINDEIKIESIVSYGNNRYLQYSSPILIPY